MTEREIQTAILLAASRGDTRLFRINAGVAWQGTVLERTSTQLVLANPYAVRLGPLGISDLIGWGPGGRFAALEVKAARGRPTPEQLAFLELVRHSGGIGAVVRSVDEALAGLRAQE